MCVHTRFRKQQCRACSRTTARQGMVLAMLYSREHQRPTSGASVGMCMGILSSRASAYVIRLSHTVLAFVRLHQQAARKGCAFLSCVASSPLVRKYACLPDAVSGSRWDLRSRCLAWLAVHELAGRCAVAGQSLQQQRTVLGLCAILAVQTGCCSAVPEYAPTTEKQRLTFIEWHLAASAASHWARIQTQLSSACLLSGRTRSAL